MKIIINYLNFFSVLFAKKYSMRFFVFLLFIFPIVANGQVKSTYPIKVTYDGARPARNIAIFNLEGTFLDASNEYGMARVPESELSMPLVFYKLGWKKDTIKVRLNNPTVDITPAYSRLIPPDNRQAAKDFFSINERNIPLYGNKEDLMEFEIMVRYIDENQTYKEEGTFIRKVKDGNCSYGICYLKNINTSSSVKDIISSFMRAQLPKVEEFNLADHNRLMNDYLKETIHHVNFFELVAEDSSSRAAWMYINKKKFEGIVNIQRNKDFNLSLISTMLIGEEKNSKDVNTYYRTIKYEFGRNQELRKISINTKMSLKGNRPVEVVFKAKKKNPSGNSCSRPKRIEYMYNKFNSKESE
jgi:hypothetical protein